MIRRKLFVVAAVMTTLLCGVAWAFTLVQSKSVFAPTATFDFPVDDGNLLHAYSADAYNFWPHGAGVTWTPRVVDGNGIYHSYATGPFTHNADGTVTVRGSVGRTPPPTIFTIEELAP